MNPPVCQMPNAKKTPDCTHSLFHGSMFAHDMTGPKLKLKWGKYVRVRKTVPDWVNDCEKVQCPVSVALITEKKLSSQSVSTTIWLCRFWKGVCASAKQWAVEECPLLRHRWRQLVAVVSDGLLAFF